MNNYIIITDNTTDFPQDYVKEHNLCQTALTVQLDGKSYNENWIDELGEKEIYARMRNGALPTTMQVNPEQMKEVCLPFLKEGKDVLYLGFSSGLSGSYNSESIGAEELREQFPDRKIVVLDTLCASLGQGLLVHKALKLQEAGKSMEEVIDWVENHKLDVCHYFTVDDLFHLYRGGRVSKASAIMGTMIGIKPVLHVDNEGKLKPIAKVRGRKQSLNKLVDYMEESMGKYNTPDEEVFISHGDCLEDALYVKELVKTRFHREASVINFIGPVIGSHSGCGTLALFFMGEKR